MSDLVPTIAADDARDRLARVRARIEAAADDLTALYAGRAWLALGFDSWEALCDAELGGVRIALPRAERREVVAGMREAGMPVRAIATATGVSVGTVASDLSRSELNTSEVLGRDGKTYPAKVTTTTRTTEATKVERDVDLDTGEIVDLGSSEAAGRAAADRAVIYGFIESDDGYRAANLRRDLIATLRRWQKPADLSPEEAALLLDDHQIGLFQMQADDNAAWVAALVRAHRTGLRVINGGSQ